MTVSRQPIHIDTPTCLHVRSWTGPYTCRKPRCRARRVVIDDIIHARWVPNAAQAIRANAVVLDAISDVRGGP